MMIKIENLSKKYIIRQRDFILTSVREAIAAKTAGMFKRAPQIRESQEREFYALRDINLKIAEGETVGVVGRNGSGKTTLLKILSRITFPSTGQISLFGRVGALLEAGAGFNGDLTGRENVFLVGAMLGMTIPEIRSKYDRIIAFAGVEKFAETQVKHYSSGMYLRLAFSVAAHFEPEILLLDEVLAVGDAEFRQRCFDKIGELNSRGHTILLVTHDLQKMSEICSRAIWLESGKIKMDDSAEIVKNNLLQTEAGRSDENAERRVSHSAI